MHKRSFLVQYMTKIVQKLSQDGSTVICKLLAYFLKNHNFITFFKFETQFFYLLNYTMREYHIFIFLHYLLTDYLFFH